MTQLRKQPASSNLTDILNNLKTEIFATLNCIKIAKIVKFDKAKKCADVQIQFKKVTPVKGKEIVKYPMIQNCPVFTLQGSQSSLQMPIKEGDTCLLLFSDRNIDIWWRTGSEAAPADHRCHHMTDAIAIVGINSLQNTLPSYTDDVVLTVTPGQDFLINRPQNVTVTGGGGGDTKFTNFNNFDVIVGSGGSHIMGSLPLALLWELNQLIQIFNTHTHICAGSGTPSTPPVTPAQPAQGTQKLFGS